MITWIQETLHKHLKTIFIVLLVVVGVSFIGTVGRSPGLVRTAHEVKPLNYYGYNLRSVKDIEFLRKAALISSQVHSGLPPLSEEQLETLVHMRPALLWVADKLAIPAPTAEQMRNFLMSRPLFLGEKGVFDSNRYNKFVERSEGETEELLLILEQDYRMQAVQALMEGPGYALDYESQRILEIAHTRWNVEDAVWDMNAFNPHVSQDKEVLNAYFEKNKAQYFRKKQVRVSYVLFSPDAYLDAVQEPSLEEIKEARQKDFNGAQDLLNAQIADHIKRNTAKKLAQEAAYTFQYALFDKHIDYKGAAFNTFVHESKLKLQELSALEPGQRITQFPVIEPKALSQLFDLDSKQYYSNPISAGGFFIIFFLDEHLPQRSLSFEEAQTQVARDHRREEIEKLFKNKGNEIKEALQSGLSADASATFESLAQSKGLQVKSYKDFSLDSPPADFSHNAFDHLQALNPGELSSFFVDGQIGHVLYVVQKLLPTTTEYEDTFMHIQSHQDMTASRLRGTAVLRHLMKPASEE